MTNEEAFLNDVHYHPADDAPRLVYADWLEERGDPRADFIRAQCEWDRLSESDPRRDQLDQESRGLLKRHGAQWKQPLRALAWKQPRFQCGFVEDFQFPRRWRTAAFIQHRERIFRAAPLIRNVAFRHAAWAMEELTACPDASRFLSLDLSNNGIGDAGAEVIARSPRLRRLMALNLSNNEINDRGVQALADSPHVSELRRLNLRRNRLTDRSLHALAESPHLSRLVSLQIGLNGCSPEAADKTANSPRLESLAYLDSFSGPEPTPRAIAATRLEVDPGRGIGPVRLGMSRKQVFAALEQTPHALPFETHLLTDGYFHGALQICHDAKNQVQGIHLGRGKLAECELDGVLVFERDGEDVLETLERVAGAAPVAWKENSEATSWLCLDKTGTFVWTRPSPANKQRLQVTWLGVCDESALNEPDAQLTSPRRRIPGF